MSLVASALTWTSRRHTDYCRFLTTGASIDSMTSVTNSPKLFILRRRWRSVISGRWSGSRPMYGMPSKHSMDRSKDLQLYMRMASSTEMSTGAICSSCLSTRQYPSSVILEKSSRQRFTRTATWGRGILAPPKWMGGRGTLTRLISGAWDTQWSCA